MTKQSKIAIIRQGKIIYQDEHVAPIKPNDSVTRESREEGRRVHRKDILQRNDVNYFKAYPEKLKELSPELRRQLS